VALTDALGDLVRFALPPGRRFETAGVPPPVEGIAFGAPSADEAFDSGGIVAEPDDRGAEVVTARHPRRTEPPDIDREMHERRHLIENFSRKLKEPERVALRSDETDESYAGMIRLAAAVIDSR
jgi:transposase